jgi:hypothetical protein
MLALRRAATWVDASPSNRVASEVIGVQSSNSKPANSYEWLLNIAA